MKIFLIFFYIARFDLIFKFLSIINCKVKLLKYQNDTGRKINFVEQGGYDFAIMGDPNLFEIHNTSHIKSNTYIECSGGVNIGKYVHVGRGLTIFSTNHNWQSSEMIPYDSKIIKKPVVICDYVWLGANVTILPGAYIGKGVVVAAGSVVKGVIADGEVVGGNPATKICSRDMSLFLKLEKEGAYF